MNGNYFQIAQISDAILAAVGDAARQGELLHTGRLAQDVAAKYPDCGMTLREIEDEIIRHIGLTGGAAELAHQGA